MIDLITLMTKLSGESKLFTFEHYHAQKQIIKVTPFSLKSKQKIAASVPIENETLLGELHALQLRVQPQD